jgi:hypothetical protein
MRADIRERREIIAEHLRGQCCCVLKCLRPSGFTPRRAACVDFSWACAQYGLKCFFSHRAEDFLPHPAAVGGVPSLIFQSGKDKSLFAKFRAEFFAFPTIAVQSADRSWSVGWRDIRPVRPFEHNRLKLKADFALLGLSRVAQQLSYRREDSAFLR